MTLIDNRNNDTDMIDDSSSEVLEQAAFDRDSVMTRNKVVPIEAIILSHKSKRLKTPRIQRKYEWKLDRQQAFIDSLLTNCPIPSVVFAKDKNDKDEHLYILDGHQRINSLILFFNDRFRTSPIIVKLPDCQNKLWSELTEVQQGWILNTEFPVIEVTCEREFWGYVFRQINKGVAPLKAAALWRAFYSSKLLDSLDQFADENEVWLSVFGRNDGYRGLSSLLRAVAMHFEYKQYGTPMLQWLDKFCSKVRKTGYNTNLIIERMDLIVEAVQLKVGKIAFRMTIKKGPSPSLVDCIFHAGFLILKDRPNMTPEKLGAILKDIRDELVIENDKLPDNQKFLTFQTSSGPSVVARMTTTERLVRRFTKNLPPIKEENK